jgi:hypothetical protein
MKKLSGLFFVAFILALPAIAFSYTDDVTLKEAWRDALSRYLILTYIFILLFYTFVVTRSVFKLMAKRSRRMM